MSVRCEVTAVDPKTKCCKVGDTYWIDIRQCPPMCPKLFHAIFPSAYVYLTTSADAGPGSIAVTCPDGLVTVKLTRDVSAQSGGVRESTT